MTTHEITVDTKMYRIEAVKKAAYRLANRCTIVLGSLENDLLPLRFLLPRPADDAAVEGLVRLFHQELLDEELRADIREQTESLRALILAHTFSRVDLIERQ